MAIPNEIRYGVDYVMYHAVNKTGQEDKLPNRISTCSLYVKHSLWYLIHYMYMSALNTHICPPQGWVDSHIVLHGVYFYCYLLNAIVLYPVCVHRERF